MCDVFSLILIIGALIFDFFRSFFKSYELGICGFASGFQVCKFSELVFGFEAFSSCFPSFLEFAASWVVRQLVIA